MEENKINSEAITNETQNTVIPSENQYDVVIADSALKGKLCPFCKTDINEGEEVIACPACNTPHHKNCWGENKGCTTFGCSEQHYEAQGTNPTDVCPNCGAPLGDGQEFCPKCGTPKRNGNKSFCSKCGTELNAGQEFCTKCGQKVGVVMEAAISTAISQFNASIEKSNAKSKDGIIYTILGLISGVLLFINGFFTNKTYMKIYYSSTKFYKHSFKDLVENVEDYLLIIPIIICVLLLLIIIFSWQKDKKPKFNVINIVLSAISFSILLISSLVCSGEYGGYYSDYISGYGNVTISNSFESFSLLFFVELILLATLFVLSIMNNKGKTFVKNKK